MTLHQPVQLMVRNQSGFDAAVARSRGAMLSGLSIDTVQLNVGLRCNLACRHCHVESSPTRTEEMTWETMTLALDAAGRARARTIDITGGAPEMNPQYQRLVETASAQGLKVIVRTNLTVMLQEGFTGLPAFDARHGVHLVASLPCYLEANVDKQRGRHVYLDSIEVIRLLNNAGYGLDERLQLDLVYNPGGPSLPPSQQMLEAAYRRELDKRFGIRFTRLLTITNMAIGRFLHDLDREGRSESYLQLLRDSFNPQTVDGLMCRYQLHVGWDGTMHDCDFNFAMHMPVIGARRHVRDFDPEQFLGRRIATGEHCFGCTAGCGSSCTGALV